MFRLVAPVALCCLASLTTGCSEAGEKSGAAPSAAQAGGEGKSWVGKPYKPGEIVPVAPAKGAKMDLPGTGDELGQRVFNKWCAPCHADGPTFAGTVALGEKYKGTQVPPQLEKRTDLTPETIRYFVRNGVYTMPTFRNTEISPDELDALSLYLMRKK